MNRVTLALLAAVTLGMAMMGLAVAAPARDDADATGRSVDALPSSARPAGPSSPIGGVEGVAGAPAGAQLTTSAASGMSAPGSPLADNLELWMSNTRDGARVYSVVSSTSLIWAVASYEEAQNERFEVALRDLSGIVVSRGGFTANGTGMTSVPISTTQFVNTYKGIMDPARMTPDDECLSEACTMTQSVEAAQQNCQSAPPVPPFWPEPPRPTVPPGSPTPTPNPQDPYRIYRLWLDSTLSHTATGRQAMAEVTRTLQAFIALPDARENAEIRTDVMAAQAALVDAFDSLGEVEHELNPPDRLPDVAAGCALVDEAMDGVNTADESWSEILPHLTDTSAWRLPPTSARWTGDRFEGCIQYQTDLFGVVGGVPDPGPRASARWSVGEPGQARLIFPAPDLVDRASQGELAIRLPDGAHDIYAQSVTVPGANHGGTVTAYVTDAACIPVHDVPITFSVNSDPLKPPAGFVDPAGATVLEGVATTVLSAGAEANGGTVQAFVDTGTPGGASGTRAFRVIGPAASDFISFLFFRQDRTINYAAGETLNFSVQARDEFGFDVADGTNVSVSIPEADPGVIGYYRQAVSSTRPGQPTPTPELITLGKQTEMLTREGMSQLPESTDPGYRHVGPLVVCTGAGDLTLSAVVDGATANTNDENGLKTISCRAQYGIMLPAVFKKHDIRATPRPPLPIETPTPRS